MTFMDPISGGTIIGLIYNAAFSLQTDLRAVEQDMRLIEAAICTDDLHNVPLDQAIEHIRMTPGHPKLALVDWYEQPRLIKESPRAELRAADAMVARIELETCERATFENFARLGFAKMRYRRIAALYGGEMEVLRHRKQRERGQGPGASATVSGRRLTSAQIEAIDGELETLIIDCWSSRISSAVFHERIKTMADMADGALAAAVIIHVAAGDLTEQINKLGTRIRKRNHDRHQTVVAKELGADQEPVPAKKAISDNVPLTAVEAIPSPPASAIRSEWPPREDQRRDDDDAARSLERWLSQDPAKLAYLIQRAGDGRMSLKEKPRAPQIADLFERAVDHPNVQATLDDIVRGARSR